MLKAAASSAETVRIVYDDTDVFVLLVYWTWRKTIRKNIQLEKWDGTVIDIHATVAKLGDKCGQLRLTMMNDLCIDELLVSTNFCYCWN